MSKSEKDIDIETEFDVASLHTTVSYKALLRNLEEGFPDAFEAIKNWVVLGQPIITVEGLRGTTKVVEPTIVEFLEQNRWLSPDGRRPRDEVYRELGHQIRNAAPDHHIKQPK